jgi:hypothetical protein
MPTISVVPCVVVLVVLLDPLAITIGSIVVVVIMVVVAVLIFVDLSIIDIIHLSVTRVSILHCRLERVSNAGERPRCQVLTR